MNTRSTETYRKALAAFRGNRLDAAGELLRAAEAADPDNPKLIHLAGVVALTQGRLDDAERYFERALQFGTDPLEAAASWVGLGRARLPAGRLEDALACFKRAREVVPEFAPAHAGAAAAWCDLGDYRRAEASARRALELADDPKTRLTLARVLLFQTRIDEAEELLRELAAIPEVGVIARFHLAGCSAARGRIGEAEESFRALLREYPASPAYLELAKLKQFRDRNDPDLAQMQQVLGELPDMTPHLSDMFRADLSFALAKAYDDLELPEEAFRFLSEANELQARDEPFDAVAFEERVDTVLGAGRKLLAGQAGETGRTGAAPLVIAALPRSGSTLLEQMLCGHPAIAAGGEFSPFVPVLEEIVEALTATGSPGFGANAAPGAALLARARGRMAGALSASDSLERYVTDKSPVAFLYAGILGGVWGAGRVVCLRRHPLDTALSQYMHSFPRGLGWTYKLEDIARYHLVYANVMKVWKELLGDRMIEVSYEALVHDAQGQLRRILDFCGLGYDPACVQFSQRDRPIWTASGTQVREALTSKSVGRWRRYERQLEPVRRRLEADIADYEKNLREQGVPCW